MGAYLPAAVSAPTRLPGMIPCTLLTPQSALFKPGQALSLTKQKNKHRALSQRSMWQDLALASFWPEFEPDSLVVSYFCLAWSIVQMKDIQSLDSLQQ